MTCRLIGRALGLILLVFISSAHAQQPEQVAPPPEKIQQLIQLLDDPAVKDWMGRQTQPTGPEVAAAPEPSAPADSETMRQGMMSTVLDRVKAHILRLLGAFPELPSRFAGLHDMLAAEFSDRGGLGILGLIALFSAVGAAFAYVAYRLATPLKAWTVAQPSNTPQGRLRKLGGRSLIGVLIIAAFTLGSSGTFLMFEWPPRLREIVLAFLTAGMVIWTMRVLAFITFLPPVARQIHGGRESRAFDITDRRADHWYRWVITIAAIFSVAAAIFTLLPNFRFTPSDLLAVAVPVDLLLLVATLAAVWLRPVSLPEDRERVGLLGHNAVSWLLTTWLVLLLVIRTSGAYVLFWFTVAAVALPAAIVMTTRIVHYTLRPPEGDTDAAPVAAVTVAIVDRAIRLVLIMAAAYLLARVWGLDMASMETTNPTTTLILRLLLNAAVIILGADFAWSIIKAVIKRKLGADVAVAAEEEAAQIVDPQQARLRTLLPIIQNILFAVIVVLAVLMILSSIGIQIGPLIAGAGVLGVAVGFGAQTVVKDIISGIFYLLDDAFRVGEYISSGKYMGTVESFSLRSVKLRHHRGPLFTVPFGELGAVQNHSRDWVTDKFNITVGYDTDIDFARKQIKRVGLEIAEDPEFKPWVIEPIKMQGVQEFGDYGIVLRMKMTTRPGGAFGMKRRFYVRIQQVFKEKGIELPFPTVHVQGHPSETLPGVTPALASIDLAPVSTDLAPPADAIPVANAASTPPGDALAPAIAAPAPRTRSRASRVTEVAVTPEVEAAVAQAHLSRRKKKAAPKE